MPRSLHRPDLVAPRFAAWCATSERARLIHLGRRAAYFENERGEVAAVADAGSGGAPLFATLARDDRLLDRWNRVGRVAGLRVVDGGLVGDDFELCLRRVPRFDPVPAWDSCPPHLPLAAQAWPVSGPRLEAAWETFLDSWQAAAELDRSSAAIRDLVGLGPGLTPAGDDLLVGCLFALHALRHPRLPHAAACVLEHAPRTTRVSAAWLRAAAAGEAPAAWHRLVLDLGAGQELAPALSAIAGWGASSGQHALRAFFDTYRHDNGSRRLARPEFGLRPIPTLPMGEKR